MSHTDTSLSGIEPGAGLSVSEEKRERGLKYVSKSRIETYIQCPFKFYLKYWCQHRPPGTMATERGGQIHEAFEVFHENLMEYIEERDGVPERFTPLMPDDFGLTSQWLDFIGNFWKFELRRLEEARRTLNFAFDRLPAGSVNFYEELLNAWEPVEVEAEFWLGEVPDDYERADPDHVNPDGPPVGDIPWMGKADVILNSASVPGVTGSGVTILDYKTGTAPSVKYSPDAPFFDDVMEDVFRQCEYYGWMAEDVYDIDAVAIYYPKNDKLAIGEYGVKERRFDIKQAALGMQERPKMGDPERSAEDGPSVPTNFDFEPQNLCHWGDGMCHFYNICPSVEGR